MGPDVSPSHATFAGSELVGNLNADLAFAARRETPAMNWDLPANYFNENKSPYTFENFLPDLDTKNQCPGNVNIVVSGAEAIISVDNPDCGLLAFDFFNDILKGENIENPNPVQPQGGQDLMDLLRGYTFQISQDNRSRYLLNTDPSGARQLHLYIIDPNNTGAFTWITTNGYKSVIPWSGPADTITIESLIKKNLVSKSETVYQRSQTGSETQTGATQIPNQLVIESPTLDANDIVQRSTVAPNNPSLNSNSVFAATATNEPVRYVSPNDDGPPPLTNDEKDMLNLCADILVVIGFGVYGIYRLNHPIKEKDTGWEDMQMTGVKWQMPDQKPATGETITLDNKQQNPQPAMKTKNKGTNMVSVPRDLLEGIYEDLKNAQTKSLYRHGFNPEQQTRLAEASAEQDSHHWFHVDHNAQQRNDPSLGSGNVIDGELKDE